MQDNHLKLKERYSSYRIRMKSLPNNEERKVVKKELKAFLKDVAVVFGQDIANQLTQKK